MAYNRKDYFFQKAKKENFAARSIYKLEEIDKRFNIIKSGQRILDLGAAPGSWSQYCSKKVGNKGQVIGVDLQEISLTLPNVIFLQEDMLKENTIRGEFDVVLSDMAPKTTGIRLTDQARSLELCEMALFMAEKHLKRSGHFVCKLFHSDEFEDFREKLRKIFQKVEVIKPKSTRKESKEIFFVAIDFQPGRLKKINDTPQEKSDS